MEGYWLQRSSMKLGVIELFCILTAVIEWLHICQTHKVVHLKFVIFFFFLVCKVHLNEADKKERLRNDREIKEPFFFAN